MSAIDLQNICFRVIHKKEGVEFVYLIAAASAREAKELFHASVTCDRKSCSISAQQFTPTPPYFLYAINMETGQMSHPNVRDDRLCIVCLGEEKSCVVCLGNARA